jgi:REDY-like protein HapK
MPIRYVINTLKPGVEPADYERWLREYDYRVAKMLPSIRSYRTSRIERPIRAAEDPGWSYIERIDVRDAEQYQKDLASPAGQELIRQLYDGYCDRAKHISFWAEEIPD